MYDNLEIRQMTLSLKLHKNKVEQFLADNLLRLEQLDYCAAIVNPDSEQLLAVGGLQDNTIKCVAVDAQHRDAQLGVRIISHLVGVAAVNGTTHLKVFTKPENKAMFQSMGFCLVGEAPKAVFMESSTQGMATYCRYLESLRQKGTTGVVVMNGNPFTCGHHYLVEQAAAQVDHLFVVLVKEDRSMFSYQERLDMAKRGCAGFDNVTVCEGSDYIISADTFPAYFIKQLSDIAETQMRLDLDIFAKHIAPALGVSFRFVGSEPSDVLTNSYNQLMCQVFPGTRIISRLTDNDRVISASAVRCALDNSCLKEACRWVFPTTVPFVVAHLATKALRQELELTPKPGLVDMHDSGAHQDMDYHLMAKSISALHPFFVRLATLGHADTLPDTDRIKAVGQEAEKAMFQATTGVNTHKGALFCMGIAVVAVAHALYTDTLAIAPVRQYIAAIAQGFDHETGTHGAEVLRQHVVQGALDNAVNAYPMLFDQWLPFLQSHSHEPHSLHLTLLHIMSTLDDTNVYYRAGATKAKEVKRQAACLRDHFSEEQMAQLNSEYISDNISPGGSADMLSLTIFFHSVGMACPT